MLFVPICTATANVRQYVLYLNQYFTDCSCMPICTATDNVDRHVLIRLDQLSTRRIRKVQMAHCRSALYFYVLYQSIRNTYILIIFIMYCASLC